MPEETNIDSPEREEPISDTTPQETAPDTESSDGSAPENDGVDYGSLIEEDLESLRSEFPELRGISNILELGNPIRYAALRDLGLSPAEAYLATESRGARRDNRAHLQTSVPKSASRPMEDIPKRELEIARELFSELSDREIQKLYRKVKG